MAKKKAKNTVDAEVILCYIEMYRGEMPDDEVLDDIEAGAYLDESECMEINK